MLFGPIGALIGGRAKEKTSRIINSYLIFTFLADNEVKYIAFNCTGNNKAYSFVKEFKQTHKELVNTINL